jgi:hypothetical protein
MSYIPNHPESVKVAVERQLREAVRAADAYGGTGPDAAFRAESDFDFLDVKSGELLHRSDCPYCRLRKLKRAYDRITLKGSLHDKAPH